MLEMQPPGGNSQLSRNTSSRLRSNLSLAFQQRHTRIVFCAIFFVCLILELLIVRSWLLLLLGVFDLILAAMLAWVTARPIAIFTYLRQVQRDQQHFSKVYTPLSSLDNLYQTPIDYYPTGEPQQEPKQNITTLIRRLQTHLLILGLPGAGKTMTLRAFQYEALKQYWQLLLGRQRIPLYISLREYNAFLYHAGFFAQQAQPIAAAPVAPIAPAPSLQPNAGTTQQLTLVRYLLQASEVPGLRHIRPYVHTMVQQGKILFLCDGLNEIDNDWLAAVCDELIYIAQHTQNRLVMTCRELDYQDKFPLQRLVREKHAAEALILPLKREQIARFIEQYTVLSDDRGNPWQYKTPQFMATIEQNGMTYNCTNPMMLMTMMQIINEIGTQRGMDIDTRGLLLRRFVSHIIQRELQHQQRYRVKEEEIIFFLSYVACAARRLGLRNAIQLDTQRAQPGTVAGRVLALGECAALMLDWLNTPALMTSASAPPYTQPDIEQFLGFAQSAALVSISSQGNLSFRHELIAEYFVAEYLRRVDTNPQSGVPLGDSLIQDIGKWSEPVSIWAGMIADPADLARRLASLGQSYPHYAYPALALSLACMGVMWKSPRSPKAQQQPRIILPHDVLLLLKTSVADHSEELAAIINRCAKEGSPEVYRSLLPVLMEGPNKAIEGLLLLLDKQVITQLLLDYLRDAIEAGVSRDDTNRLIHLLGLFGADTVTLVQGLIQPAAGTRTELRIALLQALGRTNTPQATRPLVALLSDEEQPVWWAAVNALGHLGPTFALDAMAEELKGFEPAAVIMQIHWATLAVLEYFLQERPPHTLTDIQYQRIIDLLCMALASTYAPKVQARAGELLLEQAHPQKNPQQGRRSVVIVSLIHCLNSQDDAKAKAVIQLLKHIGNEATSPLLQELQRNHLELVRVRIIDIVGAVRDPAALKPLLPFLGDPSVKMQEQLSSALCSYAPASIPLLIKLVKTDTDDEKARRASEVLIAIGTSSVAQIIQALVPLMRQRTELLLEVLVRIHDEQAIKPLIGLLKSVPKEKADPTIIKGVTISLIRSLGTFHNQQVVLPLLDVLLHSQSPFYQVASAALSGLGELAIKDLVAALDSKEDNDQASHIRATILNMQPFPDAQLLGYFAACSEAQTRQLMLIFIQKGDTAPFLVRHLLHGDKAIRSCVFAMLDQMTWEQVTPSLLEALSNAGAFDALKTLLLKDRRTIPLLVGLLAEDTRGEASSAILLAFGTAVITYLVPGLEEQQYAARWRAQNILVTLVRQEQDPQKQEQIAEQIVGLFGQLTPPDWNRDLPLAWDGLLNILTNALANVSIPALLKGLEADSLQMGSVKTFVRLVRKHSAQSEAAKQALLKALRNRNRRDGAVKALIELDAEVVEPVSSLVIDAPEEVTRAAKFILSNIGDAALPFIWEHYRDEKQTRLRDAVLEIFREMRTDRIKDRLIQNLTSSQSRDVEMALTLLTERISDEAIRQQPMMIPELFKHIQTHSRDRSSLNVIGLLLLQKKEHLLEFVSSAFFETAQDRDWLAYLLLLLGIEGNDVQTGLATILQNSNQPASLRAEAAALLGLLKVDMSSEATALSQRRQQPRKTRPLNDPATSLDISLRALGGLLASGKWDSNTIEILYASSPLDSPEHDLFSILRGDSFSPEIRDLETKNAKLERENAKLKRDNIGLEGNNSNLKQHQKMLETQLRQLQQQLQQQQRTPQP